MHCKAYGLEPVPEYRVVPTRRWRFDFAFPDKLIAVEIEGGTWVQGRHSRGVGIEKDCEKYAEATILGWRILRVTTDQVRRGQAINWLVRAVRESPYSVLCSKPDDAKHEHMALPPNTAKP